MEARTVSSSALLILAALLLGATQAQAAVPGEISFQGFLTDTSGVPINGSVSMTFRIYDAATLGNLLWGETQSGVTVDEGRYAVLLGTGTVLPTPGIALTALAFDLEYWLSVEVETDGEMTPR